MSLWKLIRYKLKIIAAMFIRGERRKKVARIVVALLVAAGLSGFVAGAYAVFRALASMESGGLIIAGAIVTMAFHALLLLAFVFDVGATTNIFFLSSDLPLLMAAPLPAMRVFTLKYLEAMGSGSIVSCLIAIPMLLGFGLALGAPLWFYPAAAVVLALFLSVPVSVGTLAGLLVSRYVPASRVKEVLGVAGGMLALAFWLGFQLMRPTIEENLQNGDAGAGMRAVAAYGDRLAMRLLPSSAAARTLVNMAAGDQGAALAPLGYLAAIAVVMMLVSVALARKMYVAGYAKVAPAGRARPAPHRLRIGSILGWLPRVERAIVSTTASLFLRDPQAMMPVVTISVMMALFPFLISRSRTGVFFSTSLLVQAFAALSFIGAMNMGIYATGIDGRSFWMILVSPASALRKLFSKSLVAVLFFAPLVTLAALAFRAGGVMGWQLAAKSIWLSVSMAFAGASVGVLLGVTCTDWEWTLPKRMLRVSGRLIMLGVMACFFALFAILLAVSRQTGRSDFLSEVPWSVVIPVGLIAGVLALALLRVAAYKLDEMEWKV
jgi:ABC-2 type transport system permease protein